MLNDAVVAQVFDDLRFDNTLGASTTVMSNSVRADPGFSRTSVGRTLGGDRIPQWARQDCKGGPPDSRSL